MKNIVDDFALKLKVDLATIFKIKGKPLFIKHAYIQDTGDIEIVTYESDLDGAIFKKVQDFIPIKIFRSLLLEINDIIKELHEKGIHNRLNIMDIHNRLNIAINEIEEKIIIYSPFAEGRDINYNDCDCLIITHYDIYRSIIIFKTTG